MADATILVGNVPIQATMRGGQGPMGPASGPLGAGSVTAATVSNDTAEQNAIATKLRVPQFTPDGSLVIPGALVSTEHYTYGARSDINIAAIAPAGGHSLYYSQNDNPADEMAWTGYMPKSGGGFLQVFSYFNGLVNGVNDGTAVGYSALHGETGAGGDNVPCVFWSNNSGRLGAGLTGSLPWNSPTRANLIEIKVDQRTRGTLTVGGTISDTAAAGTQVNIEGYLTVGAVTGASGSAVPAQSFYIGWHAGSSSILDQSYDLNGAAFVKRTFNASEFRFGQGHLLPDTNNTRDLGNGTDAWRNIYSVNAVTVTSDKRLKQERPAPTKAEIAWARSIRFVGYQMLAAIAEKGEDGARIHWGVMAQDVAEAGRAAGIADPYRYSFLTLDPLFEIEEYAVEVERPVMEAETVDVQHVEIVNGQAVVSGRKETREIAKVERFPMVDAAGNPVVRNVPDKRGPLKILDPKTGKPKLRPMVEEQGFHERPVIETVTEMHQRQVPVINPETGEQDQRHGVRYEPLFAFLLACGAFNQGA